MRLGLRRRGTWRLWVSNDAIQLGGRQRVPHRAVRRATRPWRLRRHSFPVGVSPVAALGQRTARIAAVSLMSFDPPVPEHAKASAAITQRSVGERHAWGLWHTAKMQTSDTSYHYHLWCATPTRSELHA